MILLQWLAAVLLVAGMCLVYLALWIFRPRDDRMSAEWMRSHRSPIRTMRRNRDAL